MVKIVVRELECGKGEEESRPSRSLFETHDKWLRLTPQQRQACLTSDNSLDALLSPLWLVRVLLAKQSLFQKKSSLGSVLKVGLFYRCPAVSTGSQGSGKRDESPQNKAIHFDPQLRLCSDDLRSTERSIRPVLMIERCLIQL
jgi:hypothetical protein